MIEGQKTTRLQARKFYRFASKKRWLIAFRFISVLQKRRIVSMGNSGPKVRALAENLIREEVFFHWLFTSASQR